MIQNDAATNTLREVIGLINVLSENQPPPCELLIYRKRIKRFESQEAFRFQVLYMLTAIMQVYSKNSFASDTNIHNPQFKLKV